MTNYSHNPSLPPPEPADPPATRPPLNLPHVVEQVNQIQTFLANERARKAKRTTEKENKS